MKSKKRQKHERERKDRKRTPERPENEFTEEHPQLQDDPGAWSDHDSDWVLNGRMP